jgi:hypothetical protein
VGHPRRGRLAENAQVAAMGAAFETLYRIEKEQRHMNSDPRPEVVRDFDILAADSVSALRKFLQQGEHTSMDIGAARVAASALSAWSRHKQTESARESNFIILARELAENKQQFRKFVIAAMPEAAIVKALPVAKAARKE